MHFLVEPSDTDVLFGDKSECQSTGNNGDETLMNLVALELHVLRSTRLGFLF